MATLNITINPGESVATAKKISNAIYGIHYAALEANTSIKKLETTVAASTTIMNQHWVAQRSSMSKTAFTATKLSESFASNFKKINSSIQSSNIMIGNMPRAFVSIEKSSKSAFNAIASSSRNALGSVTKFFGQMAIGVFLVGELVMIFWALSKAIQAINFRDNPIFGDIAYQFEILKTQVFGVLRDLVANFAASILKTLESLNVWIATHRNEIISFFDSFVSGIQSLWNTLKNVYNWMEEHPLLASVGLLGYALWGKSGMAVSAAAAVIVGAMHKMTKELTIQTAGDLGLINPENYEQRLEYYDAKLKQLRLHRQELLNEEPVTPTQNYFLNAAGDPKYEQHITQAESKYRQAVKEWEEALKANKSDIEKLEQLRIEIRDQLNKHNEEVLKGLVPDWYSKTLEKIYKDILDTSGEMIDEYDKILRKKISDTYAFYAKMLSGSPLEAVVASERSYLDAMYAQHRKKTLADNKVLMDSYKSTGIMSKQLYEVLLDLENKRFLAELNHSKTIDQTVAIRFRHEKEVEKLRKQAGIEQLEIDEKRLKLAETSKIAWGTREEMMAQMFPYDIKDYGDVIKARQELYKMLGKYDREYYDLSRSELALSLHDKIITQEQYNAAIIKLEEEQGNARLIKQKMIFDATGFMTDEYYQAQVESINRMASVMSEFEMDPTIIEAQTIQKRLKLWDEYYQSRIKGYEQFQNITGRSTIEAYQLEIANIDAVIKKLEPWKLSLQQIAEIREKLERKFTIAFLEGQEDFTGGFMAGLMRLKDEIEPWGQTISDAVVDAAHDMYSAMNDFFFDALEMRMESFTDYFTAFMSEINKITAGYLTENLKRGLASILPTATVQAGGQSFSSQNVSGSLYNVGTYISGQSGGSAAPTGGGYQAGIPNLEFWTGGNARPTTGGYQPSNVSTQQQGQMPSWGPYAGASLMASGAAYGIYQNAQGMTPGRGAVSGALSGMMAGAGIAALLTAPEISIPALIIGALAGTAGGGILGYLMGETQDKAKMELAAGGKVTRGYPSTMTPFGLFGFETAENITNTAQYKSVMTQVHDATYMLASMMSDEEVAAISEFFASGWDSKRIKGDMDPKEIEELFVSYFKEIGDVWGSSFGAWMENFDGTLDDLIDGIGQHVEAINFITDTLRPEAMTEYDSAVEAFNTSVSEMKLNLENTGGTVEELAEMEEARRVGLEKLKQVYIDSFEVLKMQMGGMSEQSAQMVMWARQFGMDVPTILSGWDAIEQTIYGMTFDQFNELAKTLFPESETALADLTAAVLAFDQASAAATATLYDINIQSGQMAGIFSDFDLEIMSINKTFDDWIYQTKDFADATAIATELEERRTAAIEAATKAYQASILELKAGLPGISSQQQRSLILQQMGLKYGINPNDITPALLSTVIQQLVTSNMPLTSEQRQDILTVYDLFYGAGDSVGQLTEQVDDTVQNLENLNQTLQDLVNDWQKLIDDINSDIEDMLFTQDNPADILTRMQLVRKSIADLGDPRSYTVEQAQQAKEYWKTLLQLGQEAYQRPSIEYQNLFNEVLGALGGIRETAEDKQLELLQQIADNTAEANQILNSSGTELFGVITSFQSTADNMASVLGAFGGDQNPLHVLIPDNNSITDAVNVGNVAMVGLITAIRGGSSDMIGETGSSVMDMLLDALTGGAPSSGNEITVSVNDILAALAPRYITPTGGYISDSNYGDENPATGTSIDWGNLHFPTYQHGGVVYSPTLAQVGEVPEAIIPLHNLQTGGDTTVQIVVQVEGGANPAEVRRQARAGVIDALNTPEAQAIIRRNQRWRSQ